MLTRLATTRWRPKVISPEVILVVRVLFYMAALACLIYILTPLEGCATGPPPKPAVYLDSEGHCRFSATGSEAPMPLCIGKVTEQ